MRKTIPSISLLIATSVVSLLALSVALYFVFVIQKKSESVATASFELTELQKTRDERLNLKKTLQTTQAQRDILASYFVGSDNVISFIELIESLSVPTKTRLEITSADTNQDTQTLSLTILASGTFQSVYHLLRLLETMPAEIVFQRVLFSVAGSGVTLPEDIPITTLPIWNAEITIELMSFGS